MKDKLIILGASTGGPGHLKRLLSALGKDFDIPIVIAQHMNPTFVPSFVKQFDNELPLNVIMAKESHVVEREHAYICATHCELNYRNRTLKLESCEGIESYYNPSVDCLFKSAVSLTRDFKVLAVLLTGIGHDGAEGLAELHKSGAKCIAESEESAIVYGMPKKAVELNPQVDIMKLDEIISYVKRFGEHDVF